MFTSQNIQKRNPIPKEKKKKKRMLITPLIVKKENKKEESERTFRLFVQVLFLKKRIEVKKKETKLKEGKEGNEIKKRT
jgi:hypothetical protein